MPRYRATIDSRHEKRVRLSVPGLLEAGATRVEIRTSKRDADGPIELQFYLADEINAQTVMDCSGLADLRHCVRKA